MSILSDDEYAYIEAHDPPEYVSCHTCGDAYAGYDPEDAGLVKCVAAFAWEDEPWHCRRCEGECGACAEEAAREDAELRGRRRG